MNEKEFKELETRVKEKMVKEMNGKLPEDLMKEIEAVLEYREKKQQENFQQTKAIIEELEKYSFPNKNYYKTLEQILKRYDIDLKSLIELVLFGNCKLFKEEWNRKTGEMEDIEFFNNYTDFCFIIEDLNEFMSTRTGLKMEYEINEGMEYLDLPLPGKGTIRAKKDKDRNKPVCFREPGIAHCDI